MAHHLAGQLLLKEDRAADALPLLEEALSVYDPTSRNVARAPTLDRLLLWKDLALAYEQLGDTKAARRAQKQIRKATVLGPNDSAWQQDQERLFIQLDQPYNGTCWDGDAYWSQVSN